MRYVLGTPLQLVTYEQFATQCLAAVRRAGVTAVDFTNSPATLTHYFLGGSPECLAKLKAFFLTANPALRIAGSRHGYFKPEEEAAIVHEINALSPAGFDNEIFQCLS